MLTWRLWKQLQNYPTHPLFRRTLRTHSRLDYWTWMAPFFSLFTCCGLWWLARFISIDITLVLIFFGLNVYIVVWVISITNFTARTYRNGLYDYLSLPPSGALGASWAICSASLHRDDLLTMIATIRNWILGSITLLGTAIVLLSLLFENEPNLSQSMLLLVHLLALLILLYTDHIQTIILACLMGMLLPTYTVRHPEVNVLSATLFVLCQLAIYTTWLLFGMFGLPYVFAIVDFTGIAADISLTILQVIIFYTIREWSILGLWQLLTKRLNSDFDNWAYLNQVV